ncbi:hypothetical protein QFW77_15195 [Luteimonas sp. RD2P54]|uniref:Uncharacterized protein n=1 Tax=Luteimonas endophytica TaxID=3042023 RepID=A0ABT6JBX3_9GAMM|nr:hypothetical protein [Luteimonas endophytica]MDH5824320.1 hypothetical protein [Luteimonas endophytica]
MNITGNVILGLLYLVPGVLFVAGLSRLYTTRTPSLFDGQISLGIVGSVVAAIAMHSLCIAIANVITPYLGIPAPDASQAISLLLSDSRSDRVEQLINDAGRTWRYVSAYFIFASISAFILGKCANRLIKLNRRANWYDLLRDEDADFIWLTTDIDVGGDTYLYAGMVKDFKIASDGELERVVLLGAVRRPIRRPSQSEIDEHRESYNERGWIEIPGEYVILRMSEARTINIDYWYLEQEREDPESASNQPSNDDARS